MQRQATTCRPRTRDHQSWRRLSPGHPEGWQGEVGYRY